MQRALRGCPGYSGMRGTLESPREPPRTHIQGEEEAGAHRGGCWHQRLGWRDAEDRRVHHHSTLPCVWYPAAAAPTLQNIGHLSPSWRVCLSDSVGSEGTGVS